MHFLSWLFISKRGYCQRQSVQSAEHSLIFFMIFLFPPYPTLDCAGSNGKLPEGGEDLLQSQGLQEPPEVEGQCLLWQI
jgi:hypothetical protein